MTSKRPEMLPSAGMVSYVLLDVVIDRSSPVPLYFQLAQQLEGAVQRGDLKPGDRIEPEIELAERTGLSRPTVRQAIQELVKKGVLIRRRGVGTQVVHSQLRRPVELSSLYDDLSRAQHDPTTRVLKLARVPADADAAAALAIDEGDEVYFLERLRMDAGEPLSLMRNWLPIDLLQLTEEDLERTGLYAMLRRAGVHLRVANQRIGAKCASAAEARRLGIRSGSALLTMQRTTYNEIGRAVEWASHVYRADSYSFETTLVDQ